MRIYFLYTGMLSFVRKDIEILGTVHEVRTDSNYKKLFRNMAKNLRAILWTDLLFCWFGSINYLPSVIAAKLLGRDVFVVAGGYDVVNMPAIGYGNMRGGMKTILVRLIFRLADRIIAVSESNRREIVENAGIDPLKVTLIYHGFAPGHPDPSVQKERAVITVGEVTRRNLRRKGLENFVRAAAYFPGIPFRLVGKWSDDSYLYLKKIASSNVEILGYVDDHVLSDMLGRAKVYVQASLHEGFGCSAAEAMLHRCVPVVSDAYSLPEVVGDCGFLVRPGDVEDLRQKISSALAADAAVGERARQHILDTFPLERRAARLLETVAHV